MKKRNIYLIACMVTAVASINSFAVVLVEDVASSINLSVDGGEANGYRATLDTAPQSFTMTGGSVTVTNTGDFAARGVYSDNLSTAGAGAVVNISGGTMTVSDSGSKDVGLIRMNDHDDSLTISGGTFTGNESGDGGLYAIRMIRDGDVTISGGTFNFSQNDSSVGGIFVGGGAAAPVINLSGGLFNDLDQFDTHISLQDFAVMNFEVLSLTDTGLTYVDGVITNKTGTITGTLADGNAFSFVFETLEDSQITVSTDPGSGGYQAWISGYDLFDDDLLPGTDVEPDGLDNLMEYALGGNPTIDDAATVSPATYMAESGLTNWFYHVSDQRADDDSLTFTLGSETELDDTPVWDTNDVFFVGESAISNNYKTVTNRTEASSSAKFIKLEVQLD